MVLLLEDVSSIPSSHSEVDNTEGELWTSYSAEEESLSAFFKTFELLSSGEDKDLMETKFIS